VFPKLIVAAFLLAHAAIHASFIAPRPPATASGPAWPFELSRSWILGPLGIDGDAARMLGLALVALTIGGFALAALAAIGVAPAGVWAPAVVAGAISSAALLAIFFHPWLVLGIAIDAGLIWAVLVGDWTPPDLAA
jgi:hypothetical protein